MKLAVCSSFRSVNALAEKASALGFNAEFEYVLVDNAELAGACREGLRCISFKDAVWDYQKNQIDGVLISADYANHRPEANVWNRAERLLSAGIKDVFVTPATLERMPVEEMSQDDKERFIVKYEDFTEPVVIKWLAFDGCNLNCSGCSHFSPLVRRPKALSPQEFESDLLELKRIFHYVKTIQFLGGEPLINRDLDKLIKIAKRIMPYSGIGILTNGLLIPKMSKELIQTIVSSDAVIHVSLYSDTEELLPEIKKILEDNHIAHSITPWKNTFRIQYNTKGNQDVKESWNACYDSLCHTIVDGKLGACYFPVTVKHANSYFGLQIPSEEYVYDIYDKKLSGSELLRKLTQPSPMCAYCNGGNCINPPTKGWTKSSKDKRIEEYFRTE